MMVTLTLNRPWSNIGTAHRLIILDICAKLFVNPTMGSKDIEWTRNTVKQCLILDCDLDFEHWSNIGTAHRVIILDICAKLFVNPTMGSKDIEQTRKRDVQTNGQRQTDNGAKNNMSPNFMGGDIIITP